MILWHIIRWMDGIFKFLHLHGKYPFGFLRSVRIIYMGLDNLIWWKKIFLFSNVVQIQKNKYAKVKVNLCKVKVWITIYFTSRRGRRILSPPKQTLIGEVLHSLGASVSLGDGDLDDCTYFSCQFNLEHCSGLGLKVNHSSFPLMWNQISPAPPIGCPALGPPVSLCVAMSVLHRLLGCICDVP